MIGTIDIEIQAKNPNMPLWPLRAYIGSPSSLRVRNVPKKIGKWEITAVRVSVVYPDTELKTAQCVLTGGVWVGTVEGSSASGSCANGYTVFADGVDENGDPVSGYVLGRGDVEILKADGTPIEDPTHFVTDDELESAISGKAEISDVADVADDLADLSNSLSDYYTKGETSSDAEISAMFESKADVSALETKADLSALNAVENSLSDYALTSQIPLSVSQLENDAGYLTAHQPLSDYYTKGETSSDAEIGAALGLKQDKLTDEQMANVNTKCLPLNLSGYTAISGNNYLDFHCLPRFFSPVVMHGALDVTQLNIVNYEVDSYMALSAIDEDTVGFVGGFNREHVAVLDLKSDTIAYISDISAMYEARVSALEARIAALEGN